MDEENRFQALVNRLEAECRKRGEIPLVEIEKIATQEGLNPSVAIAELAITEGIEADYVRGVLICR